MFLAFELLHDCRLDELQCLAVIPIVTLRVVSMDVPESAVAAEAVSRVFKPYMSCSLRVEITQSFDYFSVFHSRLVIQKMENKTLMATAISRHLKSESCFAVP